MSNSYVLEVRSKKRLRRLLKCRDYFEQNGFRFVEKGYGKSYYTKVCDEAVEIGMHQVFCKKHRLICDAYKKEYTRSTDYRKKYFDYKQFKGTFTLCAYCGLPVRVSKLTVDHIIPVDKAKKTNKAKMLMKLLGIPDVNHVKNLAGACKSCNSKKGPKMGLWVLKGFIGRYAFLWILRWIIRVAVLLFITSKFL